MRAHGSGKFTDRASGKYQQTIFLCQACFLFDGFKQNFMVSLLDLQQGSRS
ncbi:MAG: hypothetical protein V1789_06750 [PVC group bacterium]